MGQKKFKKKFKKFEKKFSEKIETPKPPIWTQKFVSDYYGNFVATVGVFFLEGFSGGEGGGSCYLVICFPSFRGYPRGIPSPF